MYAFTLRHVWRTARLPTQDVNILGDLVESVLGFWWVLEVSEMMAMQTYSETMRSFLSNLEFAVTSVYYWRSQVVLGFRRSMLLRFCVMRVAMRQTLPHLTLYDWPPQASPGISWVSKPIQLYRWRGIEVILVQLHVVTLLTASARKHTENNCD